MESSDATAGAATAAASAATEGQDLVMKGSSTADASASRAAAATSSAATSIEAEKNAQPSDEGDAAEREEKRLNQARRAIAKAINALTPSMHAEEY